MASWAKRLTSLATAFALSGSPAVLSACMALCLPGVPAAAMGHEDGAPAVHAVQALAPTPPSASGHAHHGSRAAHESARSANERASSPDSSDVRLTATCSNCCPHGVAFVAGPGVARADAHALGAAPTVVQVAHYLLTTSVLGAAPHGPPPVSPPAPPRAPLVLRI